MWIKTNFVFYRKRIISDHNRNENDYNEEVTRVKYKFFFYFFNCSRHACLFVRYDMVTAMPKINNYLYKINYTINVRTRYSTRLLEKNNDDVYYNDVRLETV